MEQIFLYSVHPNDAREFSIFSIVRCGRKDLEQRLLHIGLIKMPRINAARSNGFAIRDPPPGWNKTGHRGWCTRLNHMILRSGSFERSARVHAVIITFM